MIRTLLLCFAGLAPAAAVPVHHSPASSVRLAQQKNAALAAFFDTYDKAQLALSPTAKAFRGIVDADYGRWSEQGEAIAQKRQALDRASLAALHAQFDRRSLGPEDQLSYDLFESAMRRSAAAFPYRRDAYLFDQMAGLQSAIPDFLINLHRVTNIATADAYVSRLATVDTLLDQAMAEAKARAALGVLPPRWVFPHILRDARNVITGAPFDSGPDSALFEDIKKKTAALAAPDAEKARILAAARTALLDHVQPGYRRLIAFFEAQQAQAGGDDGVWRLADGRDYYAERLAFYTTTNLTADQIHAIGLRETARIQSEMRAIMRKIGFKGSLQDLFASMRNDSKFFYSTRADYLADVAARNAAMTAALPRYFTTPPTIPLVVKEVEPFREKSATKAFYQSPAPDGSRPGTYYVNLYDLKAMSKNEVEALFYHEGVPGHHLQRAIQVGLGELPAFRRFGSYTAYLEGWGLYAERLGKDMGFYTDPYSDLGRLSMEILRAGRLVVDTGIHAKHWSRERAVAWFMANTPVTQGDIQNQVERYVVQPGQATAYTIGKLKIEELRLRAQKALGGRFDIRAFHDVVLNSGPVPLDVLDRQVTAWIAQQRA